MTLNIFYYSIYNRVKNTLIFYQHDFVCHMVAKKKEKKTVQQLKQHKPCVTNVYFFQNIFYYLLFIYLYLSYVRVIR